MKEQVSMTKVSPLDELVEGDYYLFMRADSKRTFTSYGRFNKLTSQWLTFDDVIEQEERYISPIDMSSTDALDLAVSIMQEGKELGTQEYRINSVPENTYEVYKINFEANSLYQVVDSLFTIVDNTVLKEGFIELSDRLNKSIPRKEGETRRYWAIEVINPTTGKEEQIDFHYESSDSTKSKDLLTIHAQYNSGNDIARKIYVGLQVAGYHNVRFLERD